MLASIDVASADENVKALYKANEKIRETFQLEKCV